MQDTRTAVTETTTIRTIPAPHPSPSKPRFALPALACDAHCHVFGPGARFPYAAKRTYEPHDAPAERLRALHALLGVRRAVLVQATVHGFDNSAMLAAMAHAPDDYRGVAMVRADASERELRELHEAGVRGVRFNFVRSLGGAPDLEAVRRIASRIAVMRWHLVLHFDPQDLPVYGAFLNELPLPYVIDHMGRVLAAHGQRQEPFEALLRLMRDDRVWVKVSGAERTSALLGQAPGLPFSDAAAFARRLLEAAPERVLWGTDWPHPAVREMPDDGKLVDLLPLFSDDPVALRKLLVDNPAALYWND